MGLELKNIPLGSENFYWYERIVVGGRQTSKYLGKTLPPQFENDRVKFQADRAKEVERGVLENEIKILQQKLDTLNK